MNIAHRHLVRIAAVMALAAASTSAFAQSAEYRRGYDAGYAAGLRAAEDDRGGGNWDRRGVHIEEAEYGVRGASCDARRGVRRSIERNGVVVANNELCGDPARSQQKTLRVIYRCGDGEPARVFAREGETLRLRCGR